MIAMSGGVDSAVSAYLLKQAGYDALGATMKLYCPDRPLHPDKMTGVMVTDDVEDARNVSEKIGIPFTVLDFEKDFLKQVVDPFIASYEAGKTPNPCILCNRALKFGQLWESAQAMGAEYLATGHYAIIEKDTGGRYLLKKAADATKDQSYVLYQLTQEQLSHTLFPLGTYHKSTVREIAASLGLVNAPKRDSQDICFVPDGDYVAFITRYTGRSFPTGQFVNMQGEYLGNHSGLIHYTVGQRKGLGIALGKPAYVCRKDAAANTVTLGDNSDLFAASLEAEQIHFIPFDTLNAPLRVKAKIRYNMQPQPATVEQIAPDRMRVTFDTPQRAITPGQSVVLYDDEYVVGGGIIR